MAVKLYVGNLPYSTTDTELSDMFAQYGTVVSVMLITEKETGRPKGFGFIELETEEQAEAAIEALNNSDLGGRKLVVNKARPREERPPRDNAGGGSFRQRSW